ncbi:hypothetical protein KTT_00740 [Tengunoibacter tsumagoiensis]|uniref:Uncharacterized protein n=2 Tax=Tengunoibacter tsumagoiensis TaxID=2014871 RepID=A0A401ZTL1_9CHLR|nr:hypothetical protein KTT_00740 [Tengunoibacter tsumagoiensis]
MEPQHIYKQEEAYRSAFSESTLSGKVRSPDKWQRRHSLFNVVCQIVLLFISCTYVLESPSNDFPTMIVHSLALNIFFAGIVWMVSRRLKRVRRMMYSAIACITSVLAIFAFVIIIINAKDPDGAMFVWGALIVVDVVAYLLASSVPEIIV